MGTLHDVLGFAAPGGEKTYWLALEEGAHG
jgi:hypothetical protein